MDTHAGEFKSAKVEKKKTSELKLKKGFIQNRWGSDKKKK